MTVNLTTLVGHLTENGLQDLYWALADAASAEFDHVRSYADSGNEEAVAYHRERMLNLRDGAMYVDGLMASMS